VAEIRVKSPLPQQDEVFSERLSILFKKLRIVRIVDSKRQSHAEMLAIRKAAHFLGNYRLIEATLYTTIEPCIMCMGAIIHARLNRVVYGAPDPKWGGAGSLYNFSDDDRLNHRISVFSGVCENECRELMQSFFRYKRKNGSGITSCNVPEF
jgi:tRNA(adenine34) deaminase